MANTIDTTTNRSPSALPPSSNQQLNYELTKLANRTSDITLTTAEGDVVTISGAASMASAMNFEKIYDEAGVHQSFTSQMLTAESFSLSIQGDLNKEELQDITALVQDLQKIAHTFFKGDSGTALEQAMKIHSGASVAGFTASFQFSIAQRTSLAANHPLPDGLAASLPSLPDIAPELAGRLPEDTNYEDRLRAQWEQILQHLGENALLQEPLSPEPTGQPPQPPAQPAPPPAEQQPATPPAGHAMMERIRETVSRHPRLSPFIQPLFEKVLAENGKQASSPGKNLEPMVQGLRSAFQEDFQDWLYFS